MNAFKLASAIIGRVILFHRTRNKATSGCFRDMRIVKKRCSMGPILPSLAQTKK